MNQPNSLAGGVSHSTRVAEATAHGARAALEEVAEILFNQHAIELRLMQDGETQVVRHRHAMRAGMVEDLACDIQRLCAELKLEAPAKLARVRGSR